VSVPKIMLIFTQPKNRKNEKNNMAWKFKW